MTTLPVFVAFAVFLAAWWLTGRMRRYALARRVLDIPTARSSHSVATPRGGGMAIALATLAGLLVAGATNIIEWGLVLALVPGGTFVAAIGFMDDHRHIRRRWRLLAHIVAAVWLLTWVGGLPPLPLGGATVDLGWLGHVLAALYVVWLLNLTNFMDGIDGIAAVEVITVSLCAVLLDQLTMPGELRWATPLVLAAGAAGFLVWNWPPATVFMGDAGSGFLGFMLAGLSLQAAWMSPGLFWGWVILLGVFIVDATITLMRRTVRGDRIYDAHRSHAYQHAAQRWGSHRPVTLAVATINLGWLLPLAVLVVRGELDGLPGVLIAYAPLIATGFWLGAGRPQASSVNAARNV
jgi:Fuc2NAc and GlcNAc transferase